MKDKIAWKDLGKYIGLILCFVAVETYFRVQPDMQSLYVLPTDEVPILFDLLYATIFTTVIALIPRGKFTLKRLVYVLIYLFWTIFMFAEYIYCRIFGRVFGVKTLQYAGEGTDFAGIIFSYFDRSTFILLGVFLVLGIAGWFLVPVFPLKGKRAVKGICAAGVFIVCLAGIYLIPSMFKETAAAEKGTVTYTFKTTIYYEWIDNKRAVSMFGTYEFLARDIFLASVPRRVDEEDIAEVTEYFSEKELSSNEMTGLLEGKNLIFVLMESMDDWLINEETTPTLYRMTQEGINFTNMYTPIYGSAATLNSEFCSYTGIYAPANGNPIVNYTNNQYPYSLPNLFREQGYTARSFHYNSPEFYNRRNIHNAVGFEEYVSYLDYEDMDTAEMDATLVNNDEIYQKLTENTPFFAYVITYSAHCTSGGKNYSHADRALEIYPEYLNRFESEEMDSISAKARLTDDMFAGLLERLEEDGLLDDTVIIGVTDHYDYTISDQDYLKELSGSDNTYELSKTPFFIWAKDIETMSIDKVVNTSDIYPTICNLFGLDSRGYFIGNDVFDDDYEGYAYWQDGSWISSEGAYYSSIGEMVGDVSTELSSQMQSMISEKLKINQLMLDTDYFAQIKEND